MLSFKQYLKEQQNAATRTLAAATASRAVAAGIDPRTGQPLINPETRQPVQERPPTSYTERSLLRPGNLSRKVGAGVLDPNQLPKPSAMPSLGRENRTPSTFRPEFTPAVAPNTMQMGSQVVTRQAAKERLGGIYGAIGSNVVAGAVGALATAFEKRNARLGRRDTSGNRILGAVDALGSSDSVQRGIGGAVARTGSLLQKLRGAVSPPNVSTKLTPEQEAERDRARLETEIAQTNATLPAQITRPGSVIRRPELGPATDAEKAKPISSNTNFDAELQKRAELLGNRINEPKFAKTKSAYDALRQRRQQTTLSNMPNPNARMATLAPNPLMESKKKRDH